MIHQYKNKDAVVPLEERKQIVEALKYVDEVITVDTLDKEVVWNKKKFDIVFIGDDWKGSERWIETERVMKQYGVEVVYLPYTKGTTSTLLREKITDM